MELTLRPPARRFHPLMRPRRGFEGLGLTPGYTPAQQAMADAFASQFGAAPAVYQAPTLIPTPACIQDTGPGGTAFSGACQDLLRKTNDANIAAGSAANYAVDRANCETAWAENDARYKADGIQGPPNTCSERTYGLTLPGTTGGTNTLLPNAQTILDPGYAGPGAGSSPGTGAGSGGGTQSGAAPSLTFTNLTSGNNSSFKVGDRWQITITGAAPNQPVTVTGGMNGGNVTTQMGTTDGSGNFSLNGQMDQSQIGSWSEAWKVGPTSAGSFTFSVSPAGSTGSGPSTSKTSASTPSIFGTLPGGSVDIGGTSIPWVVIGGGALLVLVLMMRK